MPSTATLRAVSPSRGRARRPHHTGAPAPEPAPGSSARDAERANTAASPPLRGSGVRIGFNSFDEKAPVWTPDGSLLFRTDENGPPDIHLRRKGEERGTPFVVRSGVQEPLEVSPDGKWLLYGEASRTSGGDIWLAPMAFGAGEPVRVSNAGGAEPRWRGDGREIYYLAPDGTMMAAPVEIARGAIRPGASSILFSAPGALDFDVTPAGDRFLIRSETGARIPSIRLLTDWRAALYSGR